MILDDIIRYEPESTYVDFKREEYHSKKYYSLIKDVVAMANANYVGSRYIIIGVDLSNGERKFPGISNPLTDSAIYQSLLHEKVEPEIDLKYYSYPFEGVQLGILEISGCDDQPYMLKNEIQPLKKGDCFIRKGSTQLSLLRPDLDRIVANKIGDSSFKGDVNICFKKSGSSDLEIKVPRYIVLPSEKEKEKIKNALIGVSHRIEDYQMIDYIKKNSESHGKYLRMSPTMLNLKLGTVETDFAEHDKYYLFEKIGEKVNLFIQAIGGKYIDDATVKLMIPNIPGLLVADNQYTDPDNFIGTMVFKSDLFYPDVLKEDEFTVVSVHLPAIKHQVAINLFEADLRIFAGKELIGVNVPVKMEIFGKNLTAPIKKELEIAFC